jgi:tagatose 1,6-diphosphate aldolase
MNPPNPKTGLPEPPQGLTSGPVRLRFAGVVAGDAERGRVPYYHFQVLTLAGLEAGHINFRVGDTEHVHRSVGHVGYAIHPPFQGSGLAWHACRALAPWIRHFYETVILTCDPENEASRRTIERLEAVFIDELSVHPEDPQYAHGSRCKRRYRWTL